MDISKLVEEATFNISMEEANNKILHEQFDSRTKDFVGTVNKALDLVDATVWNTTIKKGFFGKLKLRHELVKCFCKRLRTNLTDTPSAEYKIPINKEKCFILAFRKSDCKAILYYAVYANRLRVEKTCEYINEFNSCEQLIKTVLIDILKNKI